MKKCDICGAAYDEQQNSCPHCTSAENTAQDSPVSEETAVPEHPVTPEAARTPRHFIEDEKLRAAPRRKGNTAVIALVTAAGLTVGTAAAGAAWYLDSAALDVKKQIEQKNYDEAKKIYQEQLRGDKLQEQMLQKMLLTTIRTSASDYRTGHMKYDAFAAQCKTILSFENTVLCAEIYAQFHREADALHKQFLQKEIGLQEAQRGIRVFLNDGLLDDREGLYTTLLAYMEQLQQSRDAYESGNIYLHYKNYAEAIRNFRQVIDSDENYADAQDKLRRCMDAYRTEVLAALTPPTTVAEYKQTIATLKAALELLPEDPDLLQRLQETEAAFDEIEKQEALNMARTYADSLNFRAALDVLNNALVGREGDAELLAAMSAVKSAYSAYTKKLVANYLASRDYNSAYSCLVEACALMPEDEALKTLLNDIQISAPSGLDKLKPSASNRFESVSGSTAADGFGNTYNGSNLFRLSAKSGDWDDADLGYAKYDLSQHGGFTRLYGTVVMASDSSNAPCGIQIYGDGKRLYSSPLLTRASAPIRVDLSLKGIKELEIRMNIDEDSREALMTLLLSGFQFYP